MRIVNYPHPTLRHVSKPIKRVDVELRQIVRQMFDLMYEARGIGLAANQVDLPLRLFVVNLAASPTEGEELVFINPVINFPKGSDQAEEGCLSLPGLYGPVVRPARVRVTAYNLSGQEMQAELDGLFARVVQHELDHLDGVLFPDRMTAKSRESLQPAMDEFESAFQALCEAGELPADEVIRQRLLEWEVRYC